MKRILAIGIILLFIGMSISSTTGFNLEKQSTTPLNGKTLYVGGSGPGNYTRIQDAIDNASDGDTVFVYNGTYYEDVVVNKSISLIGEDKNTTVIIYEYEWFVVSITADYVNISGFKIQYSYEGDGISVYSNNNNISNNIISYHLDGIYLKNSNHNIIMNNEFSSNWNCIYLISSEGNLIINNTLMNNSHGLILRKSYNNTLIENKLYYDAMCTTFLIQYSNNNVIKNNTILRGQSIWLWGSNNNTISGNTVEQCRYGIYLMNGSNDNTIFSNCLISNFYYGIKCGGDNKIYHNNFINNTQNANDSGNNTWDDGYPSGGNFWDDYNGTDEDGDGIGDTPYPIPGGDNEDRYPLMKPYGNWSFYPVAKFNWTPSFPEPNETIHFNASESIDYDGNIILYEWDWDNDGVFDENHTNYTATHSWSEYGFYPVTLRVTDNENLTDNKTKTVRVGNQLPYEPSNPIPPNGSTNWSGGGLCWTGGDPDGDEVIYDVYFGNSSPPPIIIINQTSNCSSLPMLDFNTTYYWKIVARDEFGATTEGPIWSFTTRGNNPPDTPIIEGPTSVRPGTYNYTFYSTDPEGDIVFYWINKNDGIVEWIGPYESGEEITIPITWHKKGTYTIRIKAKDIFGNESKWGILEVTVPKNRYMFFLQWLDRFPLLYQFIIRIMERWGK